MKLYLDNHLMMASYTLKCSSNVECDCLKTQEMEAVSSFETLGPLYRLHGVTSQGTTVFTFLKFV
jgi:hypothetical protein